jgi:hypothetical protein
MHGGRLGPIVLNLVVVALIDELMTMEMEMVANP